VALGKNRFAQSLYACSRASLLSRYLDDALLIFSSSAGSPGTDFSQHLDDME
jgi:hypothetical protein